MSPKPTRIAIVAGETSGDFLGADLIRALRARCPHLIFEGIAGKAMIEAGCKTLFPMERLAVMGLFEIVGRIPELLRIRRQLRQHLLANPPDVFIGIDAPEFNLTLEEQLRSAGIFTVHYNSPSVWAWRKGRLKKIARATDLMLTLFPFEAAFYEENQIPVRFVGHPLADQIPLHVDRQQARDQLGLPQDRKIIALLPGSRSNELKYLAEIYLRAAKWCAEQRQDLFFVAPMVNQTLEQQFLAIKNNVAADLPLQIVRGNSRAVMAAADAILLKAGTSALEGMLLKRPMVAAYRMSPLSFAILKRLVKIPYLTLPNLLANQALVKEFVQDQVTPENLGQALLECLQQSNSETTIAEFTKIHESLRKNASEQAADAIIKAYALIPCPEGTQT